MGVLLSEDGSRMRLAARVLVGRAPHASLRLAHAQVSGEHAVLAWQRDGWTVRDLGSRNGTWLEGRRLDPGEAVRVMEGDRLAFGGGVPFVWVGVLPPAASAEDETGRRVEGDEGVLALPGAEAPEVVVFWHTDHWVIEDEAGMRTAPTEVEAGGRRWRLELPEILPATQDDRVPRLAEVSLHLAVSRDEELVQAEWHVAETVHRPEPRVHHYLLATLARLRQTEAHDGWVEAERLARMLALDRSHLNVQVYRARQEAVGLGILDGTGLIERRSGASMRLGMAAVTVGSL